MVDAKIIPATEQHLAQLICTGLRRADELEVLRAGAKTVEDGLLDSFHLSLVRYAVLIDGKCCGLFGVCPDNLLLAKTGKPWLLASPELEKHWRRFAIVSKAKAQILFEQWDILYNWVDVENTVSIRWLRWIGFEVANTTTPYGPNQEPFHYFERRGGTQCA